MDSSDIFAKTAAGTEEVRSRAGKLPQRLRTLLIMVDGTLNGAKLQEAARTIGAPEDSLQTLFDKGLIAPLPNTRPAAAPGPVPAAVLPATAPVPLQTEGERARAAQKFMNDAAVDMLGLRAFFFTLKLEKCYSRSDLLALLPDFHKAMAKAGGNEIAKVLEQRAREMLG